MNIFSFRIIDSLSHEKTLFSPFALAFELRFRAALTRFPPCGEIVFPFSFGKTNISLKIICPLLFVFYSKKLSSIRLSKIFSTFLRMPQVFSVRRKLVELTVGEFCGRSGWTRTIDLALIRRAL